MSASRAASPKKSVAFDPKAHIWEYTPALSANPKRSSIGSDTPRATTSLAQVLPRRSRSATPDRMQQRASPSSPKSHHTEPYPSHSARVAAIPGRPNYNRYEDVVLIPNDLIEIRIRTSKQRHWRVLQVPNLTIAEIMRSLTTSHTARLAFVQYDRNGEEERDWMSTAQQELPIRRLKMPRDGFRFVIYE